MKDDSVAVRIGMAVNDISTIVSTARTAEAQGYDFLAVGEHLAFHTPTPNALVTLTAAAAVTSRIELLTSVTQLPLYPAALLAKMAAVADVISGGRFNLGVGLAGENPREFEACGVPVSERAARVDEALTIFPLLWSGKPVTFHGRFGRLEDFILDPVPVRKPPIWVSGRKSPSIRRAARHGQWWMPYMITPDALGAACTELRSRTVEAGRAPRDVRTALFVFVNCQHDGKAAFEEATARLSAQYGQDFSLPTRRYAVVGDPGQCVARLRDFIDAGAEAIVLVPACEENAAAPMRDLIAGEVLSAFR